MIAIIAYILSDCSFTYGKIIFVKNKCNPLGPKFFIYLRSEKVSLSCELIGNRVQITNCRATVSNMQRLSSTRSTATSGKDDENCYKSGYLPFSVLTMLSR